MERIVDRWLTLNIHPDVLRGMNRAEYKVDDGHHVKNGNRFAGIEST